MMEVIRSSETPVLTRATRRNITEDGILPSHRRENLKSKEINYSGTYVNVHMLTGHRSQREWCKLQIIELISFS
jgi:hypothetical protein